MSGMEGPQTLPGPSLLEVRGLRSEGAGDWLWWPSGLLLWVQVVPWGSGPWCCGCFSLKFHSLEKLLLLQVAPQVFSNTDIDSDMILMPW